MNWKKLLSNSTKIFILTLVSIVFVRCETDAIQKHAEQPKNEIDRTELVNFLAYMLEIQESQIDFDESKEVFIINEAVEITWVDALSLYKDSNEYQSRRETRN